MLTRTLAIFAYKPLLGTALQPTCRVTGRNSKHISRTLETPASGNSSKAIIQETTMVLFFFTGKEKDTF